MLAWTALQLVSLLSLAVHVGAQPTTLAEQILLVEDARAQSDSELSTLGAGLSSPDPSVRRQAVRAMGRLERPELIPQVTPLLTDANLDVRGEAANAVGQLARGPKGVAAAKPRLLARARVEREPRVWGVVAATLGRLQYSAAADVDEVEAVIARVLPSNATTAIRIDEVLGAVEGLEALARQSGKISRLKEKTLTGLRAAAALKGRAEDADKLVRIRRLATLALTASGAVTKQELEAGMADPDDEVRRLTMVAARGEIEERDAFIARGLTERQARVRYEALQTWGRQLQKRSCDPVITAVADSDVHVSLLAIDLLGNPCATGASPAATLQALAEVLTPRPGQWHRPAHALVSLARVAPAEARKLLPRYTAHGIWQVRMYAARAAGALAALHELDQLGRDPHDNVREAALGELVTLKRPDAQSLALDALSRSDYQLILTATRALAGAQPKDRVVSAALQALARITAEKRETSRDPRMALLARLEELGAPDGAALGQDPVRALAPYLTDFDPAIAARTAEILQEWHKDAPQAAPMRLPRMPVTLAAVDAIRGKRLRVVMAGRGPFELRLFTDEAPVSALRVATRAREGYYNGLTFHRVAPNFVIQGGSPGANEYMGDGPYLRDEVGLRSHRRGTVGISTRGRDTGDAQLFVNLVDSPRLDHTYTVFAEVVTGMDIVDAIVEGDVIERIEVVPAGH